MTTVESLKAIHSILKDVTSVKIFDLSSKNLYSHLSKVETSILDAETQLAKVIASLNSDSLKDDNLKDVSLNSDNSVVESSCSSARRTLDVAFFDRLEDLGVTRDVAADLFAVSGVYAIGVIVTEVFLEEKWERPEITFLYLGSDIRKIIDLLHLHGYDYVNSVPTDWDLPGAWGCINFLKLVDSIPVDDGSSIRIIFSSATNERSDEFAKRMIAMTPEKATDFIIPDFLKTFYNGKRGDEMRFTIMKPTALHKKKTFLTKSMTWGPWEKRGFSISPFQIPISRAIPNPKITTFPRSFSSIETPSPPSPSSSVPSPSPSHPSPSSSTPSSSSQSFGRKERMTMLESFNTRLEEIGINHRFIHNLLDNRLAIASGSIVTQAVLGEAWLNVTHFTLLETSAGSIATSLNANGYFVHDIMVDRTVYVKHLNILNAPGVSAKTAMIIVIKYNASAKSRHRAILNITDDTFDGVKFSVLDATKERIKLRKMDYSDPIFENVYKMHNFKLVTATEDAYPKTDYDTFNPTI